MLAGLWAAVLIPATRGGRDAAYDGRSMQGFHTAMRVLSRRTAPADGRYLMAPGAAAARAELTAAQRLRRRRRAVLVRLCWAAGLTLLAAVVLRGPWPALHGLTDLVLAGYVVRLRRQVLAETAARRRARLESLARREAAHRSEYEAAHHRAPVPAGPVVPTVRVGSAGAAGPAYADERRAASG